MANHRGRFVVSVDAQQKKGGFPFCLFLSRSLFAHSLFSVLSVIAPFRSCERILYSKRGRARRQSDLYSNESRWKPRFIDAPSNPVAHMRIAQVGGREEGRKIKGLSYERERMCLRSQIFSSLVRRCYRSRATDLAAQVQDCTVTSLFLGILNSFLSPRFIIIHVELTARHRDFLQDITAFFISAANVSAISVPSVIQAQLPSGSRLRRR